MDPYHWHRGGPPGQGQAAGGPGQGAGGAPGGVGGPPPMMMMMPPHGYPPMPGPYGMMPPYPPMGMQPPMYGMPPGGMPPMMYGGPMPPGMMPGGMPPGGPRSAVPAPSGATIWVGKIAPGINDDTMKRILIACCAQDGRDPTLILTWRRQVDTRRGGVPMQFGFVDFRSLEEAWRAMRVLQGLKLGDRELQLKADEKNQKILDEYKSRKLAAAEVSPKAGGDAAPAAADEYSPDEGTLQMAQPSLDPEVLARIEGEEKRGDDAALELIRPIQEEVNTMYLEMMNQDLDKVTDTEMVKAIRAFRAQKAKEEEDSRKLQEERQREYEAKQQRIREDLERKRRADDRELKEFSHRLREWEDHERAREAEFDRRERQEHQRIPERQRVLEIDELDESSNRRRIRSRDRRRERLREFESDEKERRAEELIEADRRRMEQERLQREQERERQRELHQSQAGQSGKQQQSEASHVPAAASAPAPAVPVKVNLAPVLKPTTTAPAAPALLFGDLDDGSEAADASRRKRSFQQFALSEAELADLKNQQEPIEMEQPAVKRAKFDGAGAPSSASAGPTDFHSLIDRIPQDKQELFRYPIQWPVVTEHKIVELKLRPWIAKKMVEYLDEEEATLVDFVCTKLAEREKPQELISQLSVVLEEEAEVFVVKLWRMLLIEMIKARQQR
eukprot:TRINITY_DN3861_c0_g2_i1.p1 TRINITY_DN3861_c0_g2~~TRINITY_DN3861_c0_g2_i1.p1  ORF type:complete len:675 (-),score=170.60 TRINITY_DN3861_c0_g2_i1:38-2062(-)